MDKLNPNTAKLPRLAIVTNNCKTEKKLQLLKNCNTLQEAIDTLNDKHAKIQEITRITDSFCGDCYYDKWGNIWAVAFILQEEKSFDFLKFFSWLGTINSVIGAFLVANGFFLIGYIIFASGAVLWLIVAKMLRNNAMLLLEFIFLVANINGIITNL